MIERARRTQHACLTAKIAQLTLSQAFCRAHSAYGGYALADKFANIVTLSTLNALPWRADAPRGAGIFLGQDLHSECYGQSNNRQAHVAN